MTLDTLCPANQFSADSLHFDFENAVRDITSSEEFADRDADYVRGIVLMNFLQLAWPAGSA